MSAIEYNNLLFEISQKLDELNVRERLLFMCRGKLASGSEDNIQDALSLFKELEEQNILGIDRLEVVKELLKGVREWSLFGKVKKLESKRKEYNDLLEQIIGVLDELNDLERLIAMCRGEISAESEGHIEDVPSLFKELKNQNNLEFDRLDILKGILTKTEKYDLLKEVEKFEERRNNEDKHEGRKAQAVDLVSSAGNMLKAPLVGIVSSLKRVAASLTGAVKLVCNFRIIAGGILVVNSALALRKCSSQQEYKDAFNGVVLPASTKLVEINNGSLCFTVQAEIPSALKELWDIYKNGTLQSRLQEFLITEEIKELASGEDIEVTVYMDEQEYKQVYFDLMLLENQAVPDVKEEERRGRECRRNSDSFLCFKHNEAVDELALMKLKHAENQLNCERQEVMKLKKEAAEARNKTEEVHESRTEGLERSRKRRRRNSDSNLYCKTRDDDIGESQNEPKIYLGEERKHLDSERYAFVQNYLQNIHETHSMTTETSDSGIRTLGEPSNIEMQDITYNSRELWLKDLSHEVVIQLRRRLQCDKVATRRIYQSFGTEALYSKRIDIFNLFPDTPVKLLEDVFEALQLHDLLDLLEKEKPQTTSVRSLRIALPLQEVEKLKKTVDQRPTTYHSSAAVLIIADNRNNLYSEGIRDFFKGLNAKSDITIRQYRDEFRYDQQEMASVMSPASAVIERWIHNQGNFSLFAVFVTGLVFGDRWMYDDIIKRLVSGIPDKVKFVMGPRLVMEKELPETLLVEDPFSNKIDLGLMLEILNKRWRKLDLISMGEEFKRSLYVKEQYEESMSVYNLYRQHVYSKSIMITDHLTSLPRFKKEEDITD